MLPDVPSSFPERSSQVSWKPPCRMIASYTKMPLAEADAAICGALKLKDTSAATWVSVTRELERLRAERLRHEHIFP